MSQEPTPEEIERVKAWQEERRREAAEKSRLEREERERRQHDELKERLVGRTIVSVEGDRAYDAWEEIRLEFNDGSKARLVTYCEQAFDIIFPKDEEREPENYVNKAHLIERFRKSDDALMWQWVVVSDGVIVFEGPDNDDVFYWKVDHEVCKPRREGNNTIFVFGDERVGPSIPTIDDSFNRADDPLEGREGWRQQDPPRGRLL